MPKKMTQSDFITKANKIHNNIYNYSKTIYINAKTKIIITCKDHGDFIISPDKHLSKGGCQICSDINRHMNSRLTTSEFITKANKKHNYRYDYSKSNYISQKHKLTVTCIEHGDWECNPNLHIRGSGCPKCFGTPNKGLDKFIEEANKIHNFKYNYSKSVYTRAINKLTIICPEHGEFQQSPNVHISQKCGCPKCAGNTKYTLDNFCNKANLIHNNQYDYSLVEYKNNKTKVKIICSDHGEFLMSPSSHINQKYGCPNCSISKGEKFIYNLLKTKNIVFEQQKTFTDCTYKGLLRFDFYIPEKNIVIEFDGIQHFTEIEYFGGEKGFHQIQIKDNIKTEYCLTNNIKLIRLNYKMSDTEIIDTITSNLFV